MSFSRSLSHAFRGRPSRNRSRHKPAFRALSVELLENYSLLNLLIPLPYTVELGLGSTIAAPLGISAQAGLSTLAPSPVAAALSPTSGASSSRSSAAATGLPGTDAPSLSPSASLKDPLAHIEIAASSNIAAPIRPATSFARPSRAGTTNASADSGFSGGGTSALQPVSNPPLAGGTGAAGSTPAPLWAALAAPISALAFPTVMPPTAATTPSASPAVAAPTAAPTTTANLATPAPPTSLTSAGGVPRTTTVQTAAALAAQPTDTGLLGLAQASLPPDFASGGLTHISYTQLGNNANPFHYNAIPLTLTLGDGSRVAVANPTGGTRTTQLNTVLNNNGAFAGGGTSTDFSLTGKVTIKGTTYNGTLLTGQVRDFGALANPTDSEFEVAIAVTGGMLPANPATAPLKVGDQVDLLIHQPGLPISSFPQSFNYTGFPGSSDLRKLAQVTTNSNPLTPACGCASSDQPLGSGTGSSQDNANGSVYMNDGEYTSQFTGLTIPGRGIDWNFAATYRTGIQTTGPLGNNWDFNYDIRLMVVNTQNLNEIRRSFPMGDLGDLVRIDGGLDRADIYVNNGNGTYTDPNGYFTLLTQNPDGSFSERDQGGTILTFSTPDFTGRASITSETDREGDTLQFQYNSLGQLATVIDTLGRPITYSYNSTGLLSRVTDYTGRTLSFSYDPQGDLADATSPVVTGTPNGNDFPNGKTEQYTYSDGYPVAALNHEMLTDTAPNEVATGGPPRVNVTYVTNTSSPNVGRVQSLVEGGTDTTNNVPAGGTIQYSYQALVTSPPNNVTTPVSQTTVTDRNGNVTTYQFNQLGNILQTEQFNNRDVRPSDPTSYVTTYQYSQDYLLLEETMPQGNSVQYVYDSSNPDRLQQGNLLSVTQIPDAARGGDQSAITTTYTYEPIYDQIHTMTEPRGNDPTYVPQNGGTQSAARYTTTYNYDYQEGTNFAALGASLGLTAAQTQTLLANAGIPMGLGDVNGDGLTNQIAGNLIREQDPSVTLLAGSNEAAIEGTTQQPIVTLYQYNNFSKMTETIDPEGNVNQYNYYSVASPGSGSFGPGGGGYLSQSLLDTTSNPIRDSGTNPTPADISNEFVYDAVGNVTRAIDGRGIETDYVYNQLNEVVETMSAAVVPGTSGAEPLPLTAFSYLSRTFYDYNDNVVISQVEDRGNTLNVTGNGNPPAPELPPPALVPGAANPGYPNTTYFINTIYQYDILDQQVGMIQQVANPLTQTTEYLTTLYRYDPNGNQVLTVEPEGNATATYYDERDLVYQSTSGATSPPPLALLAPSDPTDYEVRGGLPSTVTNDYDLNGNLIETVSPDMTDISLSSNGSLLNTNNSKLPSGTSTGSDTTTTLNDTHQAWMTNQWQGRAVQITSGTGAGQVRVIASNTATQLTLVTPWTTVPDTTSVYTFLGDETRFQYDGFDRPVSVVDSVGNESVTQYDPDGNVVRVSFFGPTGGASPISDGPATLPGPVSSLGVIQSANLVDSNLLSATETSYDELGRVFQTSKVLFVNTIPTVRPADVAEGGSDVGLGSLTPGQTQAIPGVTGVTILGRVSDRTEYDRDSRAAFTVADDLNTTRTFYDGVSRVIETNDGALNNGISNGVANPNNIVGNTVETAYDADSNVIETRETDVSQVPDVANEIFLTTNFYDSLSRLQETVDNLGETTYYRYNSRDDLVAMADADGPVSGSITRRAFPDGPLTVDTINSFGNVTIYFYDGLDRKVMDEQVLTASGQGDGVHIGASIYGVMNDPAAPESFLPTPDPSQSSGDGLIRTATTYDMNSLTSAVIDDNGNVTLYVYDDLDRQVAESEELTVSLVNSKSTGGNTATTLNDTTQSWTTNQWAGDLVEITGGTGTGQATTVVSNSPNQLVVSTRWTTNPDATSTYIIATPLTNATILGARVIMTPTAETIDDPATISPAAINTQLAETQGRLAGVSSLFPPPTNQVVAVAAPDTNITGSDPVGNVLIRQDDNGTEVFTRYDGIDRPIAVRVFRNGQNDSFTGDPIFAPAPVQIITNPNQTVVVVGTTIQDFQYDGLSRMTLATDNNDPTNPNSASAVTDAYDSLGRIVEETQQTGSLPAQAIDSAWRANSLRKSLTYPNDRVDEYTYDHLDRLATVADQGASQDIAQYFYIGVDRVLERLYPINGTIETYLDNSGTVDIGYDGDRRPVEESDLRSDNSLIVGFTYTYDRMNYKVTQGQLQAPAYDETYTYDSADRLIAFTQGTVQETWKLDGVGNWLAVNGETRQYNSSNELIQSQSGSTTTGYTYDSNGNETSDGTYSYTYDFMNRISTVTLISTGALIATYFYDSDDRRIESTITNSGGLNGTTYFYLDGWQEIEEHNASNVLSQQYVYGRYIDEPLVIDRNLTGGSTATAPGDQRLFYHQNALYSVYALTDATTSANIVEGYEYDAYGKQTVFSPGVSGVVTFTPDDVITPGGSSQVANPYMFTGRRLDPENGLYYYRTRFYDPTLGRFIQRDSFGFVNGPNLYMYALDCPPEIGDPLGLCVLEDICGPDVTASLKRWLANLNTAYSNASASSKATACENLYNNKEAGTSWDIHQLHQHSRRPRTSSIKTAFPFCATGKCEGTVMVAGKCFHAGAVNYVIFGVMNKLCINESVLTTNTSVWAAWQVVGHLAHGPFDTIALMFENKNEQRLRIRRQLMENFIAAWKGGLIPGRPKAPNYESSVAWAQAGFEGWPNSGGIPTVTDQWSNCKECKTESGTATYTGTFTGRWTGLEQSDASLNVSSASISDRSRR